MFNINLEPENQNSVFVLQNTRNYLAYNKCLLVQMFAYRIMVFKF